MAEVKQLAQALQQALVSEEGLSEEQVRERLAQTRPPEPRGVQVQGQRSTANLQRGPQGIVSAGVVETGAPLTKRQEVPRVGAPPVVVEQVEQDGGGIELVAQAARQDTARRAERRARSTRRPARKPAARASRK